MVNPKQHDPNQTTVVTTAGIRNWLPITLSIFAVLSSATALYANLTTRLAVIENVVYKVHDVKINALESDVRELYRTISSSDRQ